MILFLVAGNFSSLLSRGYQNKLITETGFHKKVRSFLIKDQNILFWP